LGGARISLVHLFKKLNIFGRDKAQAMGLAAQTTTNE